MGRIVDIREQLARFVMVGACGTLVQYIIFWAGVSFLGISAPWASGVGYAVGSVVNYFLNYTFTFGSKQLHRTALIRYYVVVGAGWILTLGLMTLFVNVLHANVWVAQVMTTVLCMIFNFLFSRIWIYHSRKPE
ncbi:GtrA-like protein [compost metagenome]